MLYHRKKNAKKEAYPAPRQQPHKPAGNSWGARRHRRTRPRPPRAESCHPRASTCARRERHM